MVVRHGMEIAWEIENNGDWLGVSMDLVLCLGLILGFRILLG